MSELDAVMASIYAYCVRVHARSLFESLESGDFMRARQLVYYINEDMKQLGDIAPRLAPGAILPAAQDAEVLAVKQRATLAQR